MDPEVGTGGLDPSGKSQVTIGVSKAWVMEETWVDPEGGTGGLDPSCKSQVAIGFLRNTGTDALGPIASGGRVGQGVWTPLAMMEETWVDPEGGTGCLNLSGKSQVTIGFLRNTGTDVISCKQGMGDRGNMGGSRG